MSEILPVGQFGRPIIIVAHPRSGSHLTIDLLRKQFQECKSWKHLGETKTRLYLDFDKLAPKMQESEAKRKLALGLLNRAPRPIIKAHGLQFWLKRKSADWVRELVANSDVFYIYRDGRKVLCSLHEFLQSYDPSSHCSLSDFIHQQSSGVSRPKKWANLVTHWLDQANGQPNVHLFKFEDFIHKTDECVDRMGNILNLNPLRVEPLLPSSISTLWQSRWMVLTQRQPESTAHITGTKTPKWQEVWSPEDRRFFHQEAGDLLMQLGYEESDQWVSAA